MTQFGLPAYLLRFLAKPIKYRRGNQKQLNGDGRHGDGADLFLPACQTEAGRHGNDETAHRGEREGVSLLFDQCYIHVRTIITLSERICGRHSRVAGGEIRRNLHLMGILRLG